MPRYIDVDAFRKEHRMNEHCEDCERNARECQYNDFSMMDFCGWLDDAPSVDAVPVVHARWIEPVPGDGFPYCGNCKKLALDKGLFLNAKLMDWYKTKFCPNCGAKMDLVETNAEMEKQ